MKKLRYVIEIEDTGDQDCRLLAKVILPNGRETAQVFEPLVPMLNTIKATLADDIESRL